MVYVVDRWVKFKEETSHGTWVTPDTFPNYILDWDSTEEERRSEEELIAGERDQISRVFTSEGVVARMTQQLVSSKPFYLVLGSHTSPDTASPYSTISPASTLPSLSFYRGLLASDGSTISLGYYGMKVDTAELVIEAEEDITFELNFAGVGATVPTAIAKPTLQELPAFSYHNCSITVGGTFYSGWRRLSLSLDNKLSAIYAANLGYRPEAIREGGLEVSGRITVHSDLDKWESIVRSRSEYPMTISMIMTGKTIEIRLSKVAFGEYGEALRGLEGVEPEIPFRARRTGTTPAITVYENSGYTLWTDMPY